MDPGAWLLSAEERAAAAPRSRPGERGAPWSPGNDVRPLVHGTAYFKELADCVRRQQAGDLLFFTDWRGDRDERLDERGDSVAALFAGAAERGVIVKGLIWRSHMDRLRFNGKENRHLGDDVEDAGGQCLLDARVRLGGSHHQKLIVLRHPGRPESDVAFVGGIDLCHARRDDERHLGDPQGDPFASVYGPRPPWHDAQVAVRGPAVCEVERLFRERWDDPHALTRNPVHRLRDLLSAQDTNARALPPMPPPPAPQGTHTVQVLRTYPMRRPAYPFAPRGERSIALGYTKALSNARSLIYVEDQYFWSKPVAQVFADALAANPRLRLIVVGPRFPDQDGRLSEPPNYVGRVEALELVRAAGGDRCAFYGLENHEGTPVYVHAKVCVVDDVWATTGSDNFNLRSWTHDSEACCAVLDETADTRPPHNLAGPGDYARRYARDLRLRMAREHLDLDADSVDALCDPRVAFESFARCADALDAWYAKGRIGPRPAGRLRRYHPAALSRRTRVWAPFVYRHVYDPDGRPPELRRSGGF